jgi:hypothetical protein
LKYLYWRISQIYFVKYAQNLITKNLYRTLFSLKICAVFIDFFLRLLTLGYVDDCRNDDHKSAQICKISKSLLFFVIFLHISVKFCNFCNFADSWIFLFIKSAKFCNFAEFYSTGRVVLRSSATIKSKIRPKFVNITNQHNWWLIEITNYKMICNASLLVYFH